MPLIGFLSARSPDDTAHLVASFRNGLAENGSSKDGADTLVHRVSRR